MSSFKWPLVSMILLWWWVLSMSTYLGLTEVVSVCLLVVSLAWDAGLQFDLFNNFVYFVEVIVIIFMIMFFLSIIANVKIFRPDFVTISLSASWVIETISTKLLICNVWTNFLNKLLIEERKVSSLITTKDKTVRL